MLSKTNGKGVFLLSLAQQKLVRPILRRTILILKMLQIAFDKKGGLMYNKLEQIFQISN